jgi:hypothetical protein
VAENCVASRSVWAECPKRGGFEIDLRIGFPYQITESEWACPIGLSPLYDHLRDQHGIDSWQVLMLAQRLAKTLLSGFVEDGGRLLNSQGRANIDIAKLFESGI